MAERAEVYAEWTVEGAKPHFFNFIKIFFKRISILFFSKEKIEFRKKVIKKDNTETSFYKTISGLKMRVLIRAVSANKKLQASLKNIENSFWRCPFIRFGEL